MVKQADYCGDEVLRSREMVQHLGRSEIFLSYAEAFHTTTGLPLALRAVGTVNCPLHEAKTTTLAGRAGSIESDVPIRVGATTIAYLHTGQGAQVVSRLRFAAMVRLLELFSAHLASVTNQLMVMRAAAELPAVAKARIFIAEHQTEEISPGRRRSRG